LLAEIAGRRDELPRLFRRAVATQPDSPDARYCALDILALMEKPEELRRGNEESFL